MELKRIDHSTALLAIKVGFKEKSSESLTQALLQQWLRVEHNIIIYVEYDFDYTKTNYRGVIRSLNKEGIPQYVFTLEYSSYTSGIQKVETVPTNYRYTDKDYATYEEALEEALVIGLNLLKDGTV